jgi:hypothetical protein
MVWPKHPWGHALSSPSHALCCVQDVVAKKGPIGSNALRSGAWVPTSAPLGAPVGTHAPERVLNSPPAERRLALDIVLGHPAWDEKSVASPTASPQSDGHDAKNSRQQSGKGVGIQAYTRMASRMQAHNTRYLNTTKKPLMRPASATSNVRYPHTGAGDDEQVACSEVLAASAYAAPDQPAASEAETGHGNVGAENAEARDDLFLFSEEEATEEDKYDAIELIDTYEDEEESRAVEAFELAVSAAIEADAERPKLHGMGRAGDRKRFEKSRFETQEPLLVQGKEVVRPSSSIDSRSDASRNTHTTKSGPRRPQSSLAPGNRRPPSTLDELREIRRRTRGLSPELQRILARAKSGRGFGMRTQSAQSPEFDDEEGEAQQTFQRRSRSGSRSRSRSRGPAARPSSACAALRELEGAPDIKGRGTVSSGGGVSLGFPHSGTVQRRLALVSPLVASVAVSNVSFGKDGWRTKAAGGGRFARPSSAFVGARPIALEGDRIRVRARSAQAEAKSLGKEMELGIAETPEVRQHLQALPRGGGSQAAVTHARETFVSTETCSVVDAAQDENYPPVPPNHLAVEMYDRPAQLHEIYLIPKRKTAGREDATECHRWIETKWADLQSKHKDGRGMAFMNKAHHVLSAGFHELLRQVYMVCSERGRALEHVWRLHLGLTDTALEYAEARDADHRRLQAMFSKTYASEGEMEREVEQRVEARICVQKGEYEGHMQRARSHEEQLVYRMVGMEQMIERLSIKYEKSKRICRDLTARAGVMRDMLTDAEEGFDTFLHRDSAHLAFHGSWSRRPQKELERQQAYLRGQREQPHAFVQTVSTEKIAAWESMHDKIFDLLLDAEGRSTGIDAEIDVYKRSLDQAVEVGVGSLSCICVRLRLCACVGAGLTSLSGMFNLKRSPRAL